MSNNQNKNNDVKKQKTIMSNNKNNNINNKNNNNEHKNNNINNENLQIKVLNLEPVRLLGGKIAQFSFLWNVKGFFHC